MFVAPARNSVGSPVNCSAMSAAVPTSRTAIWSWLTNELNIRDGAGLDANVLDTLIYGFTASVIDGPVDADGYTWFEIQTSAITGWVAGEYLAVD